MDMKMIKSNMTAIHVDTSLFELPVYAASSLQYRTPTAIPKVLFLGNNKLTGTIPKEIYRSLEITKRTQPQLQQLIRRDSTSALQPDETASTRPV
jgi:hypothetical protein